jgi:hypothetical protein
MSTETPPSITTAMIGSAQFRSRMFTRNSTAQATAAIVRKVKAGSCAWTSV